MSDNMTPAEIHERMNSISDAHIYKHHRHHGAYSGETGTLYTPSTEMVRSNYIHAERIDGDAQMQRVWDENSEDEFDRWHAAEIRRAKAEALREAAGKALNGTWPEGFFPGVSGVARELEARANEIEASS